MLHIGLVFERTYSNWTNELMFSIHFFPNNIMPSQLNYIICQKWNITEIILSWVRYCPTCGAWLVTEHPLLSRNANQLKYNQTPFPHQSNNLVTPCGCFVPASCPLVSVFHQGWALVQSRTLRNIFTRGLKMMIWRLFVFDVETFLELSWILSIV